MLSGLIATLPVALLGAMGYAFIASFACFIAAKTLVNAQPLNVAAQVLPAVAVAVVLTTTGTWQFWVVCFTPFIIGFGITLIQGLFNLTIATPLARRGYLGNFRKWAHETEQTPEFQAAILLIDEERVREAANMSTDAEDFHDNIVRAAGLEDHEVPDEF